MSKYNGYAKRLSEAFVTAQREYTDAWEKLQKAEKERSDAQQWRQEKYIGENAARKARAEADYLAAKVEFEATSSRVWDEMNDKRRELRVELQRETKADGLANPDAIDPNGLELLKSGVLTPDDYCGLVDKYDSNPTMLRLVGRYAQEAAENLTDDRTARGALLQVAVVCKNGQSSVMRAWDSLSSIVDYCSGQAHGRKGTPGHVVSMSKWWEELSREAVENF